MPSKRPDPVAKKFKLLVEESYKEFEFSWSKLIGIENMPSVGLLTPLSRPERCDVSLRLYDDEVLEKAFKFADLNPSEPEHWADLLRLFARAHFAPKPPRRSTRAWDSERWCHLLGDHARVTKDHPTASDSEICVHIQKRFNRYKGIEPATIRRNLMYARDKKKNSILNKYFLRTRDLIEASVLKKGLDLSAARVNEVAVGSVIQLIAEAYSEEET
jgi:hypothetical protein